MLIIFARMKEEWEKGHVIVAEIEVLRTTIQRAIVHELLTKSRVKTAYGITVPKALYTFNNVNEAQKFINEA